MCIGVRACVPVEMKRDDVCGACDIKIIYVFEGVRVDKFTKTACRTLTFGRDVSDGLFRVQFVDQVVGGVVILELTPE